MEDITQYRAQFLTAAQTHIQEMQRQLSDIRNNLSNHAVLHEMHISAHSLKGEAYAMGYKNFGELITVVEKYLKQLIDGKKDFPIERFPAFAYAIAMVANVVTKLEQDNQEPELFEIIKTSKEQLGV
jgi:chemotaxis protein histidine kinase CheA